MIKMPESGREEMKGAPGQTPFLVFSDAADN